MTDADGLGMGKPTTILGAWVTFELDRKEAERLIQGLELVNYNVRSEPTKTENEMREKLRRARIILDKMEHLLGPGEEAKTPVS